MEIDKKAVQGSGNPGKPEQVRVLLTDQVVLELLQGLQLAASEHSDTREDDETESTPLTQVTDDQGQVIVSEKMYCSYCDINFNDRIHQKEHYKTDWHRYNLRQKLKGLDPITEDKFEDLVAGEISSISGSDSTESSSEDESEKSKKLLLPKPIINRHVQSNDQESDEEMSAHVEGIGRRHPRVFVRNGKGQLLSIYRCVVHGKKNPPEDKNKLLSIMTSLPQQTKWAVLMNAAGHFAAAIFDKAEVLVHKTFHRYTVRAKRGTAQGLKDKQGGNIHSAGASIRRYNEAALAQEVSDLISSWSEHMKTCDRIFLRAPSFNRSIFYGGKNPPLDKKDPRVRLIPFPTRRPTFSELRRVHTVLATVECYGEEDTIHDHIRTSPKRSTQPKVLPKEPKKDQPKTNEGSGDQGSDGDDEADVIKLVTSLENVDFGELNPFAATKKPKKKKKKKANKEDTEETSSPPEVKSESEPKREFNDDEYQIRNQLYTTCKLGDIESLVKILSPLLPDNITPDVDVNLSETPETETHETLGSTVVKSQDLTCESLSHKEALTVDLLNAPFGDSSRTLLHVAVEGDHAQAVMYLLEAGADPSLKDGRQGKPPYLASNQKSVRNQFRQFMAKYPDRYDYEAAQIPAPMSAEREAEKKAKDAERRKQAKKARKDRLKDKKAEDAEKAAEQRERDRYLNLSEREKRALAAERRFVSQMDTEGKDKPALSRCWQCGSDMTGKVPFEYFDYKFCTPKCLKDHKIAQKKS